MLDALFRPLGYIRAPQRQLTLQEAYDWLTENGILVDTGIPAERLEQLRSAVMRDWEQSLVIEGSNEMSRVPFGMVAGLIDVAKSTEELLADPLNVHLREIARRRLDSYIGDVNSSLAQSLHAIHHLQRGFAENSTRELNPDAPDFQISEQSAEQLALLLTKMLEDARHAKGLVREAI